MQNKSEENDKFPDVTKMRSFTLAAVLFSSAAVLCQLVTEEDTIAGVTAGSAVTAATAEQVEEVSEQQLQADSESLSEQNTLLNANRGRLTVRTLS